MWGPLASNSDQAPVPYLARCIFSSPYWQELSPWLLLLLLADSPAAASALLSILLLLHTNVGLVFESMYAFLLSLFILYHGYIHSTEGMFGSVTLAFVYFPEEKECMCISI